MIWRILARRQDAHYDNRSVLHIKDNHVGTKTVNSHRALEFSPQPRHFRIAANQFYGIPDLGYIFARLRRSKICDPRGDSFNKVVVGLG